MGSSILVGLALWVMTRAWDASLLDRFQFRQTQTALTAYWIRQDGFHFAYPTPIFGPPWSVPLEFPLYQWLVANLSDVSAISLVSSGRIVSIVFFIAALPAIYGLASLVETDSRRRLLVPAAVLTAPICLFYSRTFMIESCAAALSVWFLWAYILSLQRASWRWTTMTVALGTLAALVKVTTFALFGIPAAIYAIIYVLRRPRVGSSKLLPLGPIRLTSTVALPAIIPFIATLSWISFSDGIKGANPFAASFVSNKLTAWNFGTATQRLDFDCWLNVGHQFAYGAISIWTLVLLCSGFFIIDRHYRRSSMLCASGFLLGPLIFTNLYAIHEYYYYPSAFFAAAAAGIVLSGVAASKRIGMPVKLLFVATFLVLQGISFYRGYASSLMTPPSPPPRLIDIIREAVPADEVVVVFGWDWNSLIPYYSQRRAILVPFAQENETSSLELVLNSLGSHKIGALVMQGFHKKNVGFVRWRTQRMGLTDSPIATSADGDLYIRPDLIPALVPKLAARNFTGVVMNLNAVAEPLDPRLQRLELVESEYTPVTSHSPFAVFSMWGVQVAALGGQPAIFANAPAELHFSIPFGATKIEAAMGLNELAHISSTPSDGIDVVIFERKLNGDRRVLYQRNLDPLNRAEDRGPQSITIDPIGPISGTLVFAIYAGPSGNMTCDWGYWRYIKFK
jgi:hypothetical protein